MADGYATFATFLWLLQNSTASQSIQHVKSDTHNRMIVSVGACSYIGTWSLITRTVLQTSDTEEFSKRIFKKRGYVGMSELKLRIF